MSYIQRTLRANQSSGEIYDFLVKEGFTTRRNPFGGGDCMLYVDSKDYTVWCCVHDDYIDLTQEYDCGGTISEWRFDFEKDNIEKFKEVYIEAVDWMKEHLI